MSVPQRLDGGKDVTRSGRSGLFVEVQSLLSAPLARTNEKPRRRHSAAP
jgi:hypothetical protein